MCRPSRVGWWVSVHQRMFTLSRTHPSGTFCPGRCSSRLLGPHPPYFWTLLSCLPMQAFPAPKAQREIPFFIKPPLSDSLFSILGLLTFQDGTWGHFIHLGATKGSVNLCSRKVGPFSGGTHFMVVLFAGKHWGPSEDPMRTRLRGTPWCLYVHVH